MGVFYLKHPRHGTKVAVAEAEAVADEANGWERYSIAMSESNGMGQTSFPSDSPHDIGESNPKADDPRVEPATPHSEGTITLPTLERAELRVQWEAKFGSPPHHRKTAQTLRTELEAE